MSDMEKLDFICIGNMKAGSTWVHQMLEQHPGISMAPKDIMFFRNKHPFYWQTDLDNYPNGLDWYLKQLEIKEGRVVGATDTAMLWDPASAERLHECFPNVKILIMMRNPIKRALSEFLYANQLLYVGDNFKDAVRSCPEFIERGMYGKMLKEYMKYFPADRFHLALQEDVVKDAVGTLAAIEKFLGVDEFMPDNINEVINEKMQPRFMFINKCFNGLQKALKSSESGRSLFKNPVFRKIRDILLPIFNLNLKRIDSSPDIDGETMKYLIDIFTDDVKLLQELTGENFSVWLDDWAGG